MNSIMIFAGGTFMIGDNLIITVKNVSKFYKTVDLR